MTSVGKQDVGCRWSRSTLNVALHLVRLGEVKFSNNIIYWLFNYYFVDKTDIIRFSRVYRCLFYQHENLSPYLTHAVKGVLNTRTIQQRHVAKSLIGCNLGGYLPHWLGSVLQTILLLHFQNLYLLMNPLLLEQQKMSSSLVKLVLLMFIKHSNVGLCKART